jgi:hypothetical protein
MWRRICAAPNRFMTLVDLEYCAGLLRQWSGEAQGAGSTEQSSSVTRWAMFHWDAQGWQSFVSDPEVPSIMAASGRKGKSQTAEIVGSRDA